MLTALSTTDKHAACHSEHHWISQPSISQQVIQCSAPALLLQAVKAGCSLHLVTKDAPQGVSIVDVVGHQLLAEEALVGILQGLRQVPVVPERQAGRQHMTASVARCNISCGSGPCSAAQLGTADTVICIWSCPDPHRQARSS